MLGSVVGAGEMANVGDPKFAGHFKGLKIVIPSKPIVRNI